MLRRVLTSRQLDRRVLEFISLLLFKGHFVNGRQWRMRGRYLGAAPVAAAVEAE
jgi:hypothetical protein